MEDFLNNVINSAQNERVEGENWCLLSIGWYNTILQFTQETEPKKPCEVEADVNKSVGVSEIPAEIQPNIQNGQLTPPHDSVTENIADSTTTQKIAFSNHSILDTTASGEISLKLGLVEGNDFIPIPEKMYNLLESQFEGAGPRITRKIVRLAPNSKEVELEIYPLCVRAFVCNENAKDIWIQRGIHFLSRYLSLLEIRSWASIQADFPEDKCRIWVKTAIESDETVVFATGKSSPAICSAPKLLTTEVTDVDGSGWRLLRLDCATNKSQLSTYTPTSQLTELAADYEINGEMQILIEVASTTASTKSPKLSSDKAVKPSIIITWPRESQRLYWRSQLMVGDRLDARDSEAIWYESTIVRVAPIDTIIPSYSNARNKPVSIHGIEPFYVLVHYRGWGTNFDCWYTNLDTTLQPLYTQSKKWRHVIEEGSFVDVCIVTNGKRSWYPGRVAYLGFGNMSGYVKVCAKSIIDTRVSEQWYDTDSENIMPLHTHTKKSNSMAAIRELSSLNTHNPSTIANFYKHLANNSSSFTVPGSQYQGNALQSWINYDDVDVSHLLQPNDYLSSGSSIGNLRMFQGSSTKAEAGAVGLKNLGNTCFMNSILQCWVSLEAITDYFLSGRYVVDINASNEFGSGGKVARAFFNLMHQMWSGTMNVVEPRELKAAVGRKFIQFSAYHQQDSHEFLLAFVDLLHEDLNKITVRPKDPLPVDPDLSRESQSALQWQRHCAINSSFIGDQVFGQFRTTVACSICQHRSYSFEAFNCLQLPIPFDNQLSANMSISLEDCLGAYFSPQQLSSTDKSICPQCLQRQSPYVRTEIERLPEILIIQLKRFYNHADHGVVRRGKIHNFVTFPVDSLNLRKYCTIEHPQANIAISDPSCASGSNEEQHDHNAMTTEEDGIISIDDVRFKYDLCAVSSHLGEIGGGHYIAHAKHCRTGIWHEFNDSRVQCCESQAAITANAYVLFYKKQTTSKREP